MKNTKSPTELNSGAKIKSFLKIKIFFQLIFLIVLSIFFIVQKSIPFQMITRD